MTTKHLLLLRLFLLTATRRRHPFGRTTTTDVVGVLVSSAFSSCSSSFLPTTTTFWSTHNPGPRRRMFHTTSLSTAATTTTSDDSNSKEPDQSNPLSPSSPSSTSPSSSSSPSPVVFDTRHVQTVLFVECGFGSDAHGQNVTKAAVRACRNAIEFNQIPGIGDLIPGGRDQLKLDVLLGVPHPYQHNLDLAPIRACFPYGTVHIQCNTGGLVAASGKIIAEMGDTNEDMIIVCAAVTVGY